MEMVSPSNYTFTESREYSPLSQSGTGDITAPVILVANLGCLEEDFQNFPSGNIALIERGNCSFYLKTTNAIQFGAVGVIVYNYADSTDVIRGTLGSPVSIPAFGVTRITGLSLQTCDDVVVHMSYSAIPKTVITANLIAESQIGDPNSVIVIGSHLDSVPDGPGINDNGSGSAANLQIALQFSASNLDIQNRVRFVWYGAEEEGLLGSEFYVSSLSESEKQNIALNLNYDMLGSPNYERGVLNGTQTPENVRIGCEKLSRQFQTYFDSMNIRWTTIPVTGRSDYQPYIDAGIPASGIETGAEVIKDQQSRSIFGGLADTPFDPCYHSSCDTFDNINQQVLSEMTRASAYLLGFVSTKQDLREWLNSHDGN